MFQMRKVVALIILLSVATAQTCGKATLNHMSAAMQLVSNQTGEAVTGGTQAADGAWPWTVSVCYKDWFGTCSYKGAGVIIGDRWVLAADPEIDNTLTDYRVHVGSTQKDGGTLAQVQNVWVTSEFKNGKDHGDINLIELGAPLKFSDHVQPICVPKSDTDVVIPGHYAWFTSWGHTSNSMFAEEQKYLQQAKLEFDNDTLCKNMYTYDSKYNCCAGGTGPSVCKKELGSPLMQKKGDTWYLYGISDTASPNGCSSAASFLRASYFCNFINDVAGIDCV
ncbi:hypothetical protein PFISCL1PPCAC_29020 [Pristionchus fissidentatus]|uniref:Peptidase S1 domain-containing protein n=1 Tax=Pristionchus fissidentatus TaxID=1538716 RepID=A0AAV5X457_9BILA|nr:hypothetical protein PFISCL1PPCAC_25422 [Pristionchus fissidentatus]GMT37723.1 hypothetical protein PFISCL1PPCAC_29020 [Pristionchus fissidentatus]